MAEAWQVNLLHQISITIVSAGCEMTTESTAIPSHSAFNLVSAAYSNNSKLICSLSLSTTKIFSGNCQKPQNTFVIQYNNINVCSKVDKQPA